MRIWVKEYAPKNSTDLVGHAKAFERVKSYVSAYTRGARPILLAGPTGVGKTSLVYALAEELDREVIEINASDTRNKAAIESLVGAASKQRSLFFRGRIILIDEVDGVSGMKDRGGVVTLVKLMAESAHPIIFTANDVQSKKLKQLRKKTEILTLEPQSSELIADHLARIAKAEGVVVSVDVLSTIALRCGGDIRAAVNDLQALASDGEITKESLDMLSEREHEEAIEQALLRVFKTTSASVALPAFDYVQGQPDKLMMWIDENLPKEYAKPEDLARGFDALAEADRFFGRIRRWQYYRFYVYIYNLLSAGIALAKDEKYKGMISYKQSERPLKIWIYNQKNAKRKRLAEQLAPQLHTSTKRIQQDVLPFLKAGWKKHGIDIQKRYNLDEDACGWFTK